MLIALDADELESAGRVAEDVFVRQMRRRRAALDLSQAELAERVTKLGGGLYQQTIAKIESGQRAVRLQEADLIAQALGTTVSEMLSEAIGDETGSPETMDIEELIALLRAAQRRRDSMNEQLHAARQREADAAERLAAAEALAMHVRMEVHRLAAQAAEVDAELRHLMRISLQRQAELNKKYGPRWREKMSIHKPITLEMIKGERANLADQFEKLVQESSQMNSRDRQVLLANIEAMRRSLLASAGEGENEDESE